MSSPENKDSDLDDVIAQTMAEAAAVVGESDGEDDADTSDDVAAEDEVEFEEHGESSNDGGEPASSEELEEARNEAQQLKDRWLRSVADLENYKKRVKRDIDDALMRQAQDLLSGFLPTVDNLERALSAAGPEAHDGPGGQLIKGIEMVREQFIQALGRHGIEPVDSVGKPFDPNVHEALQQVTSEEHAPGTVIQEFEKGFVRNGRLLRPARVIVASADSTGGAED